MMVSEHVEILDEVFLQQNVDDAREAVLDGGAQSFVVGQNTLAKYAQCLRQYGIAWTPKEIACNKVFRFGNDATLQCGTATMIPVQFAGKTGHLYVHVLPGNTPFLFPRPLMEQFGLVVDDGKKRLQWSDSTWTKVRQKDSQGHYLLDLLDDPHDLRRKIRNPDFVYVPTGWSSVRASSPAVPRARMGLPGPCFIMYEGFW